MLNDGRGPTAIPESEEQLILVDEADTEIRAAGKIDAHVTGALHRAFSVFLFRPDGNLLLQQRAESKYHSPGKWANTACGHPRPFEDTREAGERRLYEELGIHCALTTGFQARYRAELENGLVENELVHVLFGVSTAGAALNPDEASAVATISLERLARQLTDAPDQFAVWLVQYFARYAAEIAFHRDRVVMEAAAP